MRRFWCMIRAGSSAHAARSIIPPLKVVAAYHFRSVLCNKAVLMVLPRSCPGELTSIIKPTVVAMPDEPKRALQTGAIRDTNQDSTAPSSTQKPIMAAKVSTNGQTVIWNNPPSANPMIIVFSGPIRSAIRPAPIRPKPAAATFQSLISALAVYALTNDLHRQSWYSGQVRPAVQAGHMFLGVSRYEVEGCLYDRMSVAACLNLLVLTKNPKGPMKMATIMLYQALLLQTLSGSQCFGILFSVTSRTRTSHSPAVIRTACNPAKIKKAFRGPTSRNSTRRMNVDMPPPTPEADVVMPVASARLRLNH